MNKQNKTGREVMSVSFAIQGSNPEDNTFTGMASVFGNMIDTWIPTRIQQGAFAKTLQENKARIKVLYQHNQDWPIGVPISMEENSDGLLVTAKISQTTMGKDVLTLMRDKVLTELSIGFDPIKFTMAEENVDGAKVNVRYIQECRLWEFSPVTFGANSKAKISSVNSLLGLLRDGADVDLSEETNEIVRTVFNRLRALPSAEPVDLASMVVQAVLETHEGKVLSAKNKQLVNDAIQALQKLIDAAEPAQSLPGAGSLTVMNDKLRALELLTLGKF